MPIINLIFPHRLNVSVQVKDIAYFAETNPNPLEPYKTWAAGTTPHYQANQDDIIIIGIIETIQQWDGTQSVISCDMSVDILNTYGIPPNGAFIMFSKDNKVNLSSILGYYASIKLVNDSKEKAELFSVGADMFISSK
jgi:hypothetical protein